jgi:transcriptional regulator with XRE-family HTH domain
MPTAKKGDRADEIDKLIGAKVREIRLAKGLRQQNIADVLGCTFQHIHKIETGKNRLYASKLLLVRKALGCSLAELIGHIPEAGVIVIPIEAVS